jgi:hypothetical protein
MPIADFHAHTSLKYYANSHPNNKSKSLWDELELRCISLIYKLFKNTEHIKQVSSKCQSNFKNLAEGDVKLNYMVLGQLEAGFTRIEVNNNNVITENLIAWGVLKNGFKATKAKFKFMECLTGISFAKLIFIHNQIEAKNNNETYFEELKQEIFYILSHVNKSFSLQNGKNVTIRLPKNKEELTKYLQEVNSLVLVFAIEGIQAISKIGKINSEDLEAHKVHYLQAIDFLKTPIEYEGNQYSIAPVYLSPAHHFPNFLFGHAKTFNGLIGNLLNQELNPSMGIKRQGIELIDCLISNENGKRILIDVKHFSVQARRDYYDHLQKIDPNNTIPIICSHTGITNTSWKRPNNAIPEDNESKNGKNYFLDWNVNLYNEELLIIAERNGLIGIQLDEKRIGDDYNEKKAISLNEHIKESEKLLLANMLVIVHTINNKKAWDMICIGSDFDGLINSLESAPDSKSLPQLKENLTRLLNDPNLNWNLKGLGVKKDIDFILTQQEINELKFGLTSVEIMEKIFWTNLKEFTIKHF